MHVAGEQHGSGGGGGDDDGSRGTISGIVNQRQRPELRKPWGDAEQPKNTRRPSLQNSWFSRSTLAHAHAPYTSGEKSRNSAINKTEHETRLTNGTLSPPS